MKQFRLDRRVDAVAIGASAGGVEALSILLPRLCVESGISVFVVLHLPRDQPSLLVDIFASRCNLAAIEARDKELVAPNTIYFAPPDYHLLIDDGPRLSLSVDEPVNHSRPSIDVLFDSAADVYRNRLMAIVLTGANLDGAAGLRSVVAAGGVAVVECPQTARSPAMPEAALRLVAPEFVLPLADIATLVHSINREDSGAAAPHPC